MSRSHAYRPARRGKLIGRDLSSHVVLVLGGSAADTEDPCHRRRDPARAYEGRPWPAPAAPGQPSGSPVGVREARRAPPSQWDSSAQQGDHRGSADRVVGGCRIPWWRGWRGSPIRPLSSSGLPGGGARRRGPPERPPARGIREGGALLSPRARRCIGGSVWWQPLKVLLSCCHRTGVMEGSGRLSDCGVCAEGSGGGGGAAACRMRVMWFRPAVDLDTAATASRIAVLGACAVPAGRRPPATVARGTLWKKVSAAVDPAPSRSTS